MLVSLSSIFILECSNTARAFHWFQHSITNAKDRTRKIGNCKETEYEPKLVINPANIRLRRIK
jgi:hypothetical protein